MLYGIQREQIGAAWPRVADEIRDACGRSHGRLEASDVLEELMSGAMQLWIWHTETGRAVIVTKIESNPHRKWGAILIATGHNSDEWARPSMTRIEEWAKANGCQQMHLVARPGWRKKFPEYELSHLFLEKDL